MLLAAGPGCHGCGGEAGWLLNRGGWGLSWRAGGGGSRHLADAWNLEWASSSRVSPSQPSIAVACKVVIRLLHGRRTMSGHGGEGARSAPALLSAMSSTPSKQRPGIAASPARSQGQLQRPWPAPRYCSDFGGRALHAWKSLTCLEEGRILSLTHGMEQQRAWGKRSEPGDAPQGMSPGGP